MKWLHNGTSVAFIMPAIEFLFLLFIPIVFSRFNLARFESFVSFLLFPFSNQNSKRNTQSNHLEDSFITK